MTGEPAGVLRVVALGSEASAAGRGSAGDTIVVSDAAWTTGGRDEGIVLLRDVAERVLRDRDLIADSVTMFDRWIEAAGVVDAMTCDGTSFWYHFRLHHWKWLETQVLWTWIADDLVVARRPKRITCGAGLDPELVAALRRVAARDGIQLDAPGAPGGTAPQEAVEPAPVRAPEPPPTAARSLAARSLAARAFGRLRRVTGGPPPQSEGKARRAAIAERLERLGAEPGRLVVLLAHARQRVDTPAGPRLLNVYLGPIVERLRGSRLEPIEIDISLRLGDDDGWARLNEPDAQRLLPAEAISIAAGPREPDDLDAAAEAAAATVEGRAVPLVVSGVDLGPELTARVAAEARRALVGQYRGARNVRRLLRRLRPAGVLLADEYHRQTWLAAARAEGIPAVAVQHGLIYRWHNGYIHPRRPASLPLAARTYVFGRWERDLLLTSSVYREDEVRVGGSPRLDLVPDAPVDRAVLRRELGVADGDRLLVVSGTWGTVYRQILYPIALARLFDRPIPRLHVVVKLHPGEQDEGPYGAVIEGVAAARGFAAPRVSVVQQVDLYRLLAGADAHLGIHSTVLTEAVWTRTPNLLATGLAGADLLGYVDAGVAHAVRDGAELEHALDRGLGRPSEEQRRAFLEAHFEPGDASGRIAEELLAWL